MKRLRRAIVLAGLVCGLDGGAAAQIPVGRVSGTVRDETGKPIPGATVTATNPDQAPSTLTTTTDVKGRFGILGLRRGGWVFAIAAPGFQPGRTTGEVQTGRQNPPMNVRLLHGSAGSARQLLTFTGTEIQTMIDAAEAAAAAGDATTAISRYRDLLAKVPALTTAYLRIGALLEQSGTKDAALDAYRELVRLEPGNAAASAAVARLTRTP